MSKPSGGRYLDVPTHFLGGWIYLGALLLLSKHAQFLRSLPLETTPVLEDSLLFAMAGFPIGYLINQLWYLFYSEALDIRPAISGSWRRKVEAAWLGGRSRQGLDQRNGFRAFSSSGSRKL